MKKIWVLAFILVFAVSSTAMAGLLDKAAKAAKSVASAKTVDLTLGGASADLKKYEGGNYDPGKSAYKTFGDANWDKLAESAAKTAMITDFAEKVLNDANSSDEDVQAAAKALEPLAGQAATLATSVASFVQSAISDPSKAVMLSEAKSVKGNIDTIKDKAPKVLEGLKNKAKEKAGAAM